MSSSFMIVGPPQTPFKKPEPPPPTPFRITSSTKLEDWKKWQISFRYYANAIHLEQKSHDVQLSTFKSVVGPDALEIYNTFSILDITDVESVIRKFDDHFKPKVNVTLERYKLYKLSQKSGQKFDDFLADITNQVEKCEFKSMRDEIILYKIVGGVENAEVRNALLADANLKYDKAVQICRASTAMHFMSGKENVSKGPAVKKNEEVVKAPKISYKEVRRSLLESTKKGLRKKPEKQMVELDKALEVVLTEGSHARRNTRKTRKAEPETKTTKSPKLVLKQVVRSKRRANEESLKENVAQKQSVKVENAGPSQEEFLKETVSLQPTGSAKNDTIDDTQKEDVSSDDDADSDWRADDDPDYNDDDDSDHESLKTSGDVGMKERQTEQKEEKGKKIRKKEVNKKSKKKKANKKKKLNKKKSHLSERPAKQNLSCDICNKTIGTELALERHRSIHVHGEKAVCHYCGKQFRKFFLRRHMTGSHYDILGCPPPKFFCCELCDFKTRFSENLRRHKFQHTGEKPLACEHCEYKCITPRLLKAHIAKLHTGVRPFNCSVCNRGFLHSDALKRHMITHMTPEEKQKYREGLKNPTTCETCGKVFSTRTALKTHSLRHTGEKPFACHVCEFRTVTNGALNSHIMLKHSDEKPFICTACGYSCKQKATLQLHMLTHTAEKPHTCEICGKKFAQLAHVKRHRMTHTGEKPHVCEICGHRWVTKGNLRAHMKIHQKQSGDPSQYTPPRKRQKKPEPTVPLQSTVAVQSAIPIQSAVAAVQSDESGHSENPAADAIIQWSEQVSAINTSDYVPNLETPPPFHPTYPIHQGNPRPPDCRYYQQRQWPNQGYRQNQSQ